MDIMDPGELRQLPSPLVFDPTGLEVPLKQQNMREMEMVAGLVGGQSNRLARGCRRLFQIVHRLERVAEIEPGARPGRIDSVGLTTQSYRLGRCSQFQHRTAEAGMDREASRLRCHGVAALNQSLFASAEVQQRGSKVGV